MTDATRRTLLAGAASAGATDLLPYARRSPAATDQPGPIEARHEEYLRLMAAWDARVVATWTIEGNLYNEPPQPAWHPWTSAGASVLVPSASGPPRCCVSGAAENIEALRSMIGATPIGEDVDPDWHKDRVETARRTLEAIEAWQAECHRRADAVGLMEARAEEDRARDAALSFMKAIFATEAGTFRELAFQAVGVREHRTDNRADQIIAGLLRLAGVKESAI